MGLWLFFSFIGVSRGSNESLSPSFMADMSPVFMKDLFLPISVGLITVVLGS